MAVQDSKRRVALITGVTGQDGAYLAEYLLGLGYTVTASSGDRPRSTPRASTTSMKTRTTATCRSCCTTAT
jgi:GDP-D-mannose dehydratase